MAYLYSKGVSVAAYFHFPKLLCSVDSSSSSSDSILGRFERALRINLADAFTQIAVGYLGADYVPKVRYTIFTYLRTGEGPPLAFLYVSPKMLVSNVTFQNPLITAANSQSICRCIIDEVHATFDVGANLRSDYP